MLSGSTIRSCEQCGNEFPAFNSVVAKGKAKCCSKSCATAHRVGKKLSSPRKERSDKKPRNPHVCKWCGKVFLNNTNSGVDSQRQFCSNKCRGYSAKKHNSSRPRQKLSPKLKKWACQVILRDKECVRCGARDKLQAHHIKPYATNPELALDLNNGVALCPPCHHVHHPEHKIEWFLVRGGQAVRRCVVCENGFVSHNPEQRSCSVKCGAKLRISKHNTTHGE